MEKSSQSTEQVGILIECKWWNQLSITLVPKQAQFILPVSLPRWNYEYFNNISCVRQSAEYWEQYHQGHLIWWWLLLIDIHLHFVASTRMINTFHLIHSIHPNTTNTFFYLWKSHWLHRENQKRSMCLSNTICFRCLYKFDSFDK